MIFFDGPGKPRRLPSDRAGLLTYGQVQLWSWTILCGIVSYWCKRECEKHWASVLIFILTAWILVEARKKSYTQIWWLVLTSAMLKNATLLHMSYFGVTKVPFTVLYMDLPTHLMTTVPHELMLNLRGVPLSLLFLCNAGANAVFHHSVANQSILVSTLRAISVQAVCVCAFVVARRSIIRSSFQACKAKGGSSWPEAKQLEQQQQASGVPQLHEPEAQRQLEEEQQEGLGLKHGKDAGASEHSSTVSQVQSRGDAEPSPAVAAAAAAAAACSTRARARARRAKCLKPWTIQKCWEGSREALAQASAVKACVYTPPSRP
uniref:Uncharacterized protein n=2 Tax=Dunaliella tertiolecta TaxID=3047 RepID=A0A7S3QZZ1_DUNTE